MIWRAALKVAELLPPLPVVQGHCWLVALVLVAVVASSAAARVGHVLVALGGCFPRATVGCLGGCMVCLRKLFSRCCHCGVVASVSHAVLWRVLVASGVLRNVEKSSLQRLLGRACRREPCRLSWSCGCHLVASSGQRSCACVATRAAHRHLRRRYVVGQSSMCNLLKCASAVFVARLM